MAFGWFSRGKEGEDKRLARARKLQSQGRWAEALSYYEELLDEEGLSEEARSGVRSCREQLVAGNLEEARAYETSDPLKAREHATLALELAGAEADLRAQAEQVLQTLPGEKVTARPPPPTPNRLFEPSCSCASPCSEEDPGAEGEEDGEDLFGLYLDTAEPEEREAFENLGPSFREGYVLLHQQDLEGARAALLRAAAEERTAAPHYVLGLLEAVAGNAQEAEAQFSRALETDREFGPALRHRADVLRELGRIGEAVPSLEERLGSHPEDGEARLLLAACLLDRQDFAGARRQAEEARRQLPPDDLRPGLLRARAFRLAGERAQALETLQAVLARKPDLLDGLIPTGELLLEEGGSSAERAAEVFKRCYQIDPDRGWWYLLRVSQAYAARGWKTEAQEMVERAGNELPDDPDARAVWQGVADRLSS